MYSAIKQQDHWQQYYSRTAARNRPRCGIYDRMQYEIISHSCRVSYIPLHCNSGACRITAAWIVTCVRCCIHHNEYMILSQKSIYGVSREGPVLRFGIWENEGMWDLQLCTQWNITSTAMITACRTYISWIRKVAKSKTKKKEQKLDSETRVRIEKQSKLSEIAAPTLNSMWKVYPHYFQIKKNEKKSGKVLMFS